jgi:general secretion pathway protein G
MGCRMPSGDIASSMRRFARGVGFTLIEMLIVMSIVALLLSISVPRYFASVDKSKETVLNENLRVIRTSIDKFHADKGRYPLTLEDLVEQKYIRAVPIDPITENSRSWIVIPPQDPEARGVADVKSGATGASSSGKLYESL